MKTPAPIKKQTPIEVRDSREGGFHIIDNIYLNGWARHCGIYATGVYLSLCRHVDISQSCYPTIELIAKEHNISTRTVYRALAELKKYNIIQIEKIVDDKNREKNVYNLLNKKLWKTCGKDCGKVK